MRVLTLTKYDRKGASSRLRFLQYERRLMAHGIALTVCPLLSNRYLDVLYSTDRRLLLETALAAGRRAIDAIGIGAFDVVWLEGELCPWAPAWLENLVLRGAKRLVVDYDDPIFLRYDLIRSGVMRAAYDKKILSIMRRADVVVAANAFLADHAVTAGARRVELIPTVVDLSRFPAPPDRPLAGRPVIGWIGTPQTRKYLEPIIPILSMLSANGRARVTLVGARPAAGLSPDFRFVPWDEGTEIADLEEFDIGIMPLSDDEWARGKSGFKLIQYMAAGKPVVASPVGANLDLVEPGVNGFLAATPAEWESALNRLIDDAALREGMGRRARMLVEAKYHVDAMVPRLLSALTGGLLPVSRTLG